MPRMPRQTLRLKAGIQTEVSNPRHVPTCTLFCLQRMKWICFLGLLGPCRWGMCPCRWPMQAREYGGMDPLLGVAHGWSGAHALGGRHQRTPAAASPVRPKGRAGGACRHQCWYELETTGYNSIKFGYYNGIYLGEWWQWWWWWWRWWWWWWSRKVAS